MRKIKVLYWRIISLFYPYHINIVGEMILSQKFWKKHQGETWRAGRVEIWRGGPYAIDEIRFFTNKKEWFEFESKRDLKSYSAKGIKKLRERIKKDFYHPPKQIEE